MTITNLPFGAGCSQERLLILKKKYICITMIGKILVTFFLAACSVITGSPGNSTAAASGYTDAPVTTISYTITEKQADNAAENSSLYLGNPSGAERSVNDGDNYLLEHAQYSLSYNNDKLSPNWVSWHVDAGDIEKNVSRQNTFRTDTHLPDGWYEVTEDDFQYSTYGFERGHMCPSGDRTDTAENNSATFYMTNMVPQSAGNNEKVWAGFEDHIRDKIEDGYEAYIICGPYGSGGTSVKGVFSAIPTTGGRSITVPSDIWKVVLYLQEGSDDIDRITADTETEAVFVPNTETCDDGGKTWKNYVCSIDYVENLTSYDFFARVPDSVEAVIESKE
jgi:endonuclease G, mitochondrial